MTLSLAIPGVNKERERGGEGKFNCFRVILWLYYFITDECGGLCVWDMSVLQIGILGRYVHVDVLLIDFTKFFLEFLALYLYKF